MDSEEFETENKYAAAKKGVLVGCLTCHLCSNIFREATTICACLHTFCKECIYQKLEEDEKNCCPVCSEYLGCSPLEKLRPDNNLQELTMKIFATENMTEPKKLQELRMKILPTKNPKEPESSSNQVACTKKKEKLLSSLITETNTGLQELSIDRANAAPKKAGKSGGAINKSQVNRDVPNANDDPDWTCTPPRRSKKHSKASRKKKISGGEPHQASITTTNPPSHMEVSDQKAAKSPNRKQQDFFAEAANGTNDLNAPSLGFSASEMENIDKTNSKNMQKIKRRTSNSTHKSITSGQSEEVHKSHYGNTRVKMLTPDLNEPVNILDSEQQRTAIASENKYPESFERLRPIWFSLLASQDQSENALPQISTNYIRMKDGNVPASIVNKYLVEKLNLTHESEVEVMCCDQKVDPGTTLNSLMDIWVQFLAKTYGKTHFHLNQGDINSSAQKIVLVLTYKKSK